MKAEETRFNLSSGTLAAKIWGSTGELPVLALHGWLDNANTFDHIAPQLSGVHLVAPDLAGHGLSDHRFSYYLWEHLADVAELVRLLGWNRFTLIGHSMGAGIATWFAGTFPKMVDRLVLIDGFGAPFSVEPEQLPVYLNKAIRRRQMAFNSPIDRFASGEQPQFDDFASAVEERRNGKFGQLSEEAAGILLRRGLEPAGGGYRWRNDPQLVLPTLMEPNEASINAFIRQIVAPTCLILGDHGLFSKGEKSERLSHFQQLERHTLPGDHHLHLGSAATEVATIIQSFIHNLPQPHTPSS